MLAHADRRSTSTQKVFVFIEDRRKKEQDTRQSETKMTGSCVVFEFPASFEWMTDDGFAML